MQIYYMWFDPSGNAAANFLEKAHFSDQEGPKALKLLKRKSILENIIPVHLQSD